MVDVARISYKNAEFNQNVYFNTTQVSSNDVKFWVKTYKNSLLSMTISTEILCFIWLRFKNEDFSFWKLDPLCSRNAVMFTGTVNQYVTEVNCKSQARKAKNKVLVRR